MSSTRITNFMENAKKFKKWPKKDKQPKVKKLKINLQPFDLLIDK